MFDLEKLIVFRYPGYPKGKMDRVIIKYADRRIFSPIPEGLDIEDITFTVVDIDSLKPQYRKHLLADGHERGDLLELKIYYKGYKEIEYFDWDDLRDEFIRKDTKEILIRGCFRQYIDGNSAYEEMDGRELENLYEIFRASWLICENLCDSIVR